ncbi:peptidoglycan recognition protein 5 [Danio rerio]|uniref:Peptidoglycan recognition protein 5 n=1 Tax=Danio rerio TaxID=7955 RepID=Q1W1Y2_DANRE|nr:peptidoglycan recognition protein 5 [Danio rerio]ABE01405.1 peptidoglycan recognition protein 5 [Danio rerio]|eukprot:NP_001037786.1 peptidoglycan recognition protein 1 [Danio rerio]
MQHSFFIFLYTGAEFLHETGKYAEVHVCCPSLSSRANKPVSLVMLEHTGNEKFVADMDGHTNTVDINADTVSRRGWDAVQPREMTQMESPAHTVIVHHTALRFCAHPRESVTELAHIQRMHMQERGFDDIGYNFLISGDGTVYEGRGWGIVGAHAKEHNFYSVGIAFMGNLNADLPSSASLSALLRLLHIGVLHGHVRPNFVLLGHKDVAKTACPGENLYSVLPKLRDRLQNNELLQA